MVVFLGIFRKLQNSYIQDHCLMVACKKVDLDVALGFDLQLPVKRLTMLFLQISEHKGTTHDSETSKHLGNILNHNFSWFIVANDSMANGQRESWRQYMSFSFVQPELLNFYKQSVFF